MTEDVCPRKEECGLGPIQDARMPVYDAFAELSQKHGWRWRMIGGNASGAVRHKGDFIPGNDDWDVVMTLKDQEAFRRAADKVPLPHCRRVSHLNAAIPPFLFGKTADVRVQEIARVERETRSRLPQGLFGGIGPADACCKAFGRKAWRPARGGVQVQLNAGTRRDAGRACP